MATQVGSLYTSLTLESASFLSNAKRVATATEQMAGSINKSVGFAKGAVIGFVASLSADAFVNATKRALDYAGGIGETAQQLGVSTKALQQYGYAATQVGVSQENLESGLAKLTRSLGEARDGGKKQQEAFAALGITYSELQKLSPDEAFREVARGLGGIADPARRATLEVDLFGKSGQKLDTLLAGGVTQLDELSRAANDLGVVLSDEQIAKADETADKLSSLSKVLSANFAGVVADNANSILTLANALAALAGATGRGIGNIQDYFTGLAQISKDTAGKGVIGGLTRFQAIVDPVGVTRRGAASRQFQGMMGLGNLSANGLPGFDAAPSFAGATGGAGAAKTTKAGTTAKDIYSGLSAAQVRAGGMDTLSDILGQDNAVSQGLQEAATNALDYSAALKDIGVAAATVPDIGPLLINAEAIDAANSFADSLSRGLGQAIIYGQSLGDALTSSIKAAAAELITSGLLDLLKGGKDGGGGIIGSIIAGARVAFGGGKASGGSVKAGMAYDVGELGRERFIAPANGEIIPANILKNSQRGSIQQVQVNVAPSPLFITSVAQVTAQASKQAADSAMRGATRPRMTAARGA